MPPVKGTHNPWNQSKFQAAILEFNLYLNLQLLVKNQILEAVPNCYLLEILEDNDEDYDNMTIEQMMSHLITTYGSISNSDLAENAKELDCEWDTNTELITIFSNYCKIQLFAANNDPISDKTLLRKANTAIHNARILNMCLNTFHKWPKAEQTYDNFKTDLLMAYKIYKNNLTSAKASYQSTNVAVKIQDKVEDKSSNNKTNEPTHSSKNSLVLLVTWNHACKNNKSRFST